MKEFTFRGKSFTVECVETRPQHASWFTFVDEQDVRERDWKIKTGDIICDVGAGYGSYTLTALAVGAAHVYAWSPQGPPGEEPERAFMARSLRLNGWEDRATIYDTGVYDRSGWLDVNTQALSDVQSDPSPDVIRVEPLDDWYARVRPEKIDWLKLDVEGAEVEVLKGAERLVREMHPKILVENHLFKRSTIGQEVRALLARLDYREVSTVPYHAVSHSLFE